MDNPNPFPIIILCIPEYSCTSEIVSKFDVVWFDASKSINHVFTELLSNASPEATTTARALIVLLQVLTVWPVCHRFDKLFDCRRRSDANEIYYSCDGCCCIHATCYYYHCIPFCYHGKNLICQLEK